jgi:hypothetical protein
MGRMAQLTATERERLERGRQLSPHFFTADRLTAPGDERTREFLVRIAGEARVVWPPA